MKYLIISILLSFTLIFSACDKTEDGKMPKTVTDQIKVEINEKASQERNEVN